MKLCLLPCEVYHREFDSKLNLACHLSSTHGISTLIGYDKHFNLLSQNLSHSIIVDKSCSSIMWNGRIKNVIQRGGSAFVSDEEGFNNLSSSNRQSFLNRVSPIAAKSIHTYACWGSTDYNFYKEIPELGPKLKIIGNARSDLLSDSGLHFYREEVSSLKNLYGDFVLCSDNFCIEHRNGPYSLPRYNGVTQKDHLDAEIKYRQRMKESSSNRSFFAHIVEQSCKANPHINYIIRPHPMSDPRWWVEKFWRYQNVHVIYHLPIEPWLHAASVVVSMGCTTSIQALVAKTPVIEVINPSSYSSSKNRGFSHLYTSYIADNASSFNSYLKSILVHHRFGHVNLSELSRSHWHNCFSSRVSVEFAQLISTASSNLSDISYSKVLRIFSSYSSSKYNNNAFIDPTKWPIPQFSHVASKIKRFSDIYQIKPPSLFKISSGLYFLK